jgi:adenosylmethionine-8-amino-7-oxononanoate aminotransferase
MFLSANEELVHGFTWSGHSVAAAVALKNLEVMEKRGLVPRVKQIIGTYLHRRLRDALESSHLLAVKALAHAQTRQPGPQSR